MVFSSAPNQEEQSHGGFKNTSGLTFHVCGHQGQSELDRRRQTERKK